MTSGKPDFRWATKARTAATLCLAGAVTGVGLYFVNLAYVWGKAQLASPTVPQSCVTAVVSSTPVLCVSQPYGNGDTVFVIHGSGFVPDTPVTISLVGVGTSKERPIVDPQGTFSYALDQGHQFFPGPIPPGTYTAIATVPGNRSWGVSFTVNSLPPQSPPTGPASDS